MRLVAVLGTPCGGTVSATRILRAHGLDVRHERLGPDGIVCGYAALGGRRRPHGELPYAFDPSHVEHVVRLVRDPFDTAVTLPWYVGPSLAPIGVESRAVKGSREVREALWPDADQDGPWYERKLGKQLNTAPRARAEELVEIALRYWVLAHEAIPVGAEVWHVAGLDDEWPAIAAVLGVRARRVALERESKPRRWERWTWERWRAADPEWAERGRVLWERYG